MLMNINQHIQNHRFIRAASRAVHPLKHVPQMVPGHGGREVVDFGLEDVGDVGVEPEGRVQAADDEEHDPGEVFQFEGGRHGAVWGWGVEGGFRGHLRVAGRGEGGF